MKNPDFISRRNLGFAIWFCIFVIIGFSLGGCNTVKGFGMDMHDIADGIQQKMGKQSPEYIHE